ncbi:DUF4190 domain-containing protein [Actinomycetospora sp. NBRC 106378]|uniref:DUF4190 domain-containing protein n=1 Tax=Actinomycetospora sp. NBRC 106378 TaxID=3032208 RepID=UPI0024A081E5|nr:DUF4190 domain-containing protein [Actinomycetospora sp. NBRC 106378]GLZ51806.1 hypothetical protein Acsp07_14230 [Actinomycetospora sp. NBRC 106378]
MTQQLPPYASPEQPAAGHAPAPAAPQRTNTMAILSIVFAFVFSPLGIVFGVIGRRQAAERHENGRGLATIGMWLSIAFVLIGIVTAVLVGVMAASVASQLPQQPDTSQSTPGAPTANTPVVSPDQLAPEVAAQTAAQDVTCPEPLPGQVGASTVCTATVDGQQVRLGVTVNAVNGTQVGFQIAPLG